MSRWSQPVWCAAALVPLVLGAGLLPRVDTGSTDGPVASVDRDEVEPGERVFVTLDGFAATSVTIEVCGNQARRGSSDCNMAASEGLRIDEGDEPTVSQLPIAVPPTMCPCVLRISSRDTGEIAVVPIVITGHPVGPVIEGPTIEGLVEVTLEAREAPKGLIDAVRSALGGPAPYEVTVSVRNRSVETLRAAQLSGTAKRSETDTLAVLEFADPGPIAPGQTWQQTVTVVVPSPSFGAVQWQVAVTGAGPTVKADTGTRHRPLLLIVLVMTAVVLIATVLMRRMMLRRAIRVLSSPESSDRPATTPSP